MTIRDYGVAFLFGSGGLRYRWLLDKHLYRAAAVTHQTEGSQPVDRFTPELFL